MKVNRFFLRILRGPLLSALFTAAQGFCATPEGITEPEISNLRTFLELARKDVRTEKALILSQNISLTEDEAFNFWPLYSEYELELSKWYDSRFAIIKEYLDMEGMLTEDQASKLADKAFATEEERTKLKRKYFKRFSKVVGARKAARFFQLENQLNAAIDLRLAAALPLIQ